MTPRERFLRYVTYYTTSDDFSETAPSTERQKELIRELAREMEELGLKDISFDSNSNVYGTLPANVKGAPSIALIAHVDTAPDAPGENVRPAVITCPEGEFSLESGVVMNEALCPGLSKHVGEELIVTDGTTLLGADDKAGVAEIMSAVDRLHGERQAPRGRKGHIHHRRGGRTGRRGHRRKGFGLRLRLHRGRRHP